MIQPNCACLESESHFPGFRRNPRTVLTTDQLVKDLWRSGGGGRDQHARQRRRNRWIARAERRRQNDQFYMIVGLVRPNSGRVHFFRYRRH